MSGRIRVLVTKEAIRPDRLEGATAVVIDVFMATTTLLTILENGARRVFVAKTPADVDARCRTLNPDRVLRGGEQMARKVEGYDRGPFPWEYPPEVVRGRDVVYVSTNGTSAIVDARCASRVLLGSLRNAPAVAAHLSRLRPESVYLVCAGSLGRLALDDLVGASSILSHLDLHRWSFDDAALIARDLADQGRLDDLLRRSRQGRWYFDNGREDVFHFVTEVGASDGIGEVRDGELYRVDGTRPDPGMGER